MELSFYRELGRRVARLRKQKSWTQEDLATHTEVGASYIARIETGSRRPTLEVLGQISSALGVPIWQLLVENHPLGSPVTNESARSHQRRELEAAITCLPVSDLRLLTELAHRLTAAADS